MHETCNICAIMLIATAGYIALAALPAGGWGKPWWLFAVGGILCGLVSIIIESIWKRRMRAYGTEEEAFD